MSNSGRQLATIGYEGATPEAFDYTLTEAKINLLVDVRAVAISRRRGFSKTALSARVSASGIEYLHLRSLGDPKPGRMAARAGEMSLFRTIYSAHMATNEVRMELEKLVSICEQQRAALLCFEADPTGCHRSMIAEYIATRANLEIVHLDIREQGHLSGGYRRNHNPGEGMAAA